MVSRRVRRNGIYQRTTQSEDFREAGGLTLPYRIRNTDYAGGSQVLTVSRIELAAHVDAAVLAKPPTRLADYSFPAGQDRVRVPLRLLNNHLYIPVKFNGSGPHWMMLDTGAFCLVSRSLAAALQLQSQGADAVRGAGTNAVQLDHAKLDSMEIGGIVLRDQRCSVVDLKAFGEFEGVDQFGVVGYEVYRRFVVRQNHAAGDITLA